MAVPLGRGSLSIWPVSWAQTRNMRSTRLVFSTVGWERSFPLGSLRECVGAEEFAYVWRQDALELPVGAKESLDLLEVLPVGVERALLLPLAGQVFEVVFGWPRAGSRSWLDPLSVV